MSRERRLPDPLSSLPTSLRKRQIHTDCVDAHLGWQVSTQFLPAPCLDMTDRRIKGIHHVEQPYRPGGVGQLHAMNSRIRGIKRIKDEVGCWFTWLQLFAYDGELFPQFKGLAHSPFHTSFLILLPPPHTPP